MTEYYGLGCTYCNFFFAKRVHIETGRHISKKETGRHVRGGGK